MFGVLTDLGRGKPQRKGLAPGQPLVVRQRLPVDQPDPQPFIGTGRSDQLAGRHDVIGLVLDVGAGRRLLPFRMARL